MKNQIFSTPIQEFWSHFLRNRLAVVGFGIVIGLLVVALFASFLAPQGSNTSIPSGQEGKARRQIYLRGR